MRKYIMLITCLVIVVIVYNYVFKAHRDIENETASYTLMSLEISNEFAINPHEAETKYLNKTIEISGTITETKTTQITLDNHVFCLFKTSLKHPLEKTRHTKIKGRFIGYDDLLEQIKLDQCSIIN